MQLVRDTGRLGGRSDCHWPSHQALPTVAASSFPPLPTFEAFRDLLLGSSNDDAAFGHCENTIVDTIPGGLVRGRNWFGPGICVPMTHTTRNTMKAITSYLVNDAILSPTSMSVIKVGAGLLDVSVDNLGYWDGQISTIDPNFVDAADGRHFLCGDDGIDWYDFVGMPVSGVGFPNFGHFLFDGLGAALLYMQLIANPALRLCGPPLRPWQAELLDLMNCRERYIPLRRPARFRKLLFTSMSSFHTSYPTRFVRPLFDLIRFRAGPPVGSRRVLLSRAGDTSRRFLRNRTEVEAVFRGAGFDVVRPETMSVGEQIRRLAGATFIAGETGSALANIGFSEPGATVLEIIPETYADGWIRAVSRLFGHQWSVYFANVETTRSGYHQFAFEVDIPELQIALRRLLPP